MFIEASARDALGLVRDPEPRNVREAMLRSAGVSPPHFSDNLKCDEWFGLLANELAPFPSRSPAHLTDSYIQEVVNDLTNKAPAALAPTLLAMVAPRSRPPDCDNGDLPNRCKAELRKLLPGFCSRVLAQWDDGALSTDP